MLEALPTRFSSARASSTGAVPRTITSLADYDAIGTVPLPDAHFGAEPFTLLDGRFAPWAVGRIPFDDRPQASALFARALAFPERPPQEWTDRSVLHPPPPTCRIATGRRRCSRASVRVASRRAELAIELRRAVAESAGEAFREARMRFLVDHPEERLTALAFRLWGDPVLGR